MVHFDHFLIGCMVSADYWLADYPELRRTTQPSTIGGPLGEPGFCIFCSTAYISCLFSVVIMSRRHFKALYLIWANGWCSGSWESPPHAWLAGLGYSVLVLTVLEYRNSGTRTREFEGHSTRTRTRGQVLRYSYEYWHEYWYSMVHLRCKGENHHTCEINSMTYHKGKVPNWFVLLWF